MALNVVLLEKVILQHFILRHYEADLLRKQSIQADTWLILLTLSAAKAVILSDKAVILSDKTVILSDKTVILSDKTVILSVAKDHPQNEKILRYAQDDHFTTQDVSFIRIPHRDKNPHIVQSEWGPSMHESIRYMYIHSLIQYFH